MTEYRYLTVTFDNSFPPVVTFGPAPAGRTSLPATATGNLWFGDISAEVTTEISLVLGAGQQIEFDNNGAFWTASGSSSRCPSKFQPFKVFSINGSGISNNGLSFTFSNKNGDGLYYKYLLNFVDANNGSFSLPDPMIINK
jgi:hypothetical protein